MVTSSPIISGRLNALLEYGQSRKQPEDIQTADAIVVLSGMIRPIESTHGLAYEWNDPDRFFAGIELMKANKAPIIIFTGSHLPWEKGGKAEGEILAKYASEFGVEKNHIFITDHVQNTEDEAFAVKKLLNKLEIRKIILITSAFHMPRAKNIFENENIELQTYPVDSRIGASDFTFMELIPSASALAEFDFALREFIGRIYYALKYH